MRRYLSYVTLMSALLLGVGVAAVPVINKMQTDLAYSEGKTLYFKASRNNDESITDHYGDFLDETDFDNSGLIINHLADTVTSRLDKWGLSEYAVQIQGYDTIAVSLRASGPTENDQYGYLQKYLAFSGEDFSLDSTDDHFQGDTELGSIIDGKTAWIQEIEMSDYKVPVVCIDINQSYKTKFTGDGGLIKYCQENSSEGEEGSEGKSVNVVLWANRGEIDKYTSTDADNSAKLANKVISIQSPDNAVYYKDGDTDKETPYLQLIPYSTAITDGKYDNSKSQQAYEAAVYLRNMLNAEKLTYSDKDYHLTYVYNAVAPATVENLFSYSSGYFQNSVSLSKTMISVIIAVALAILVLVLFNRILGLMQAVSLAGGTFLTLLIFVYFGSQFNVAALLGFALVGVLGCFGALMYSHKLKDELYKGRTLRKANTEACKRSFWPTIDAGIVSLFIGVLVFALAGDMASKFGTVLVIGAFVCTILNLILYRIGGWMLCSSSFMANNFGKQLGVDVSKIPDLTKEEKQTYFGPYQNRNFSKGKLWVSIVTLAFILGGTGTMIAFGAMNGGNVYNTAASTSQYTVLRLDVRSDTNDYKNISEAKLRSVDTLTGGKTDGSDIFHSVKINGKTLAESGSALTLSDNSHTVYVNNNENKKYYYFYYSAKLNDFVDGSKKIKLETYYNNKWNENENVTNISTLANEVTEFISQNFVERTIAEDSNLYNYYLTFNTVSPELGQPYVWNVLLAMGVGIAVGMVYLMLRYRPSRGFASGLAALASGFIGLGFFAMTRISVTPVVSLGALSGALITLLLSIFIFAGEKEIIAATHEKDKKSLAFRSECLNTSTSRNAGVVIVLALLTAYVLIALFGFGPKNYSPVFLGGLISLAFGSVLALGLISPMAIRFATWLSKIKFKPRKRKNKNQGGNLGKTGKSNNEPEESIFIGIND